MKAFLVYGVVLIGIALLVVTAMHWFTDRTQVGPPPCRDTVQEAPAEAEDIQFKPEMQAYGRGREGMEFDTWTFTSEDGIGLRLRDERYRSIEHARERIRQLAGGAAEVVERGPRFDPHGKQVGEKVVLKIRKRSLADTEPVVAWTEGPRVWLAESASLRLALAFYEQHSGRPKRRPLEDMRVDWVGGGEFEGESGREVHVACYRYEDGVVVKRTIAEYPSVAQAREAMQIIIRQSVRALDQRLADKDAKPNWVLLRMPQSQPREGRAVLVQREGSRLTVFESSSFRHALELPARAPIDTNVR